MQGVLSQPSDPLLPGLISSASVADDSSLTPAAFLLCPFVLSYCAAHLPYENGMKRVRFLHFYVCHFHF